MDDPSPERVHAAEALLRPAGIDPTILSQPKELCGHSARNVATGPAFKGFGGGLVLVGSDSGNVRRINCSHLADRRLGMAAARPHRVAFDHPPGAGIGDKRRKHSIIELMATPHR